MNLDKHELANKRMMSSRNDVRAFAVQILLEQGYDPSIVNLKEDGISIESFKKLVDAIYIAGYKDGFSGWANLKGELKKAKKDAKSMQYYKELTKKFNENNIYKV